MPSSGQRCACISRRRSPALACAASVSNASTRAVSQPHTSGGISSASGGTSHRGRLSTSTASASAVQPSDHATPSHQADALPRRSSPGKRLRATSSTMAGVISQATSSRLSTTMTGTASATTMIGAMSARKAPPPTDSSHCSTLATSDHCSRNWRTAATAGSHQNHPSSATAPPDSSSGSRDHRMTRGCRQPRAARQPASNRSFIGCGSYAAQARWPALGVDPQARPARRFSPSHCCIQKPRP